MLCFAIILYAFLNMQGEDFISHSW